MQLATRFKRRVLLIFLAFCQLGIAQSIEEQEIINKLWTAYDTVGPEDQATILNDLARHYSGFNIDSSKVLVKEALEIAEENNFEKVKANLFNSLGILSFMLGNYDSALFYHHLSLKTNLSLGHDLGVARNYSNIANVHFSKSETYMAVENYLEAEKYARIAGDSNTLSDVYNNLAQYFRMVKSFDRAKEYIKKSIQLSTHINISDLIAQHNNLGIVYKDMGQNDSAFSHYQKAYKICYEQNIKESKALVCNNLAKSFYVTGHLDSAECYYQKGLEQAKEVDFYGQGIVSYQGLGELYLAQAKDQKALFFLKKALNLKYVDDLPDHHSALLFLLAKVHYNIGEYKKAYENFQEANEINLKHYSQEELTKLANLEQRYKYEKIKALEKQESDYREALLKDEMEDQRFKQILIVLFLLVTIVLLSYNIYTRRRNNRLLVSKNYRIESQHKEIKKQKDVLDLQHKDLAELNAFKDKILAVFAHDLRSPLASIQSLLQLIGDADHKDLALFQSLTKKLNGQTIILLQNLENLLAWSKIQLGAKNENKPTLISSIEQEVKIVMDLFKPVAEEKEISLNLKVEEHQGPKSLNFEVARLVLRNFLSNALKYSPDKSTVELSAKCDDSVCYFNVKDSGKGIDLDVQSKVFNDTVESTLGTEKEKGNGLGLMLCSYFIKKADGQIGFKSVKDQGSSFWFEIPLIREAEDI